LLDFPVLGLSLLRLLELNLFLRNLFLLGLFLLGLFFPNLFFLGLFLRFFFAFLRVLSFAVTRQAAVVAVTLLKIVGNLVRTFGPLSVFFFAFVEPEISEQIFYSVFSEFGHHLLNYFLRRLRKINAELRQVKAKGFRHVKQTRQIKTVQIQIIFVQHTLNIFHIL
jgi:hypothetical protein